MQVCFSLTHANTHQRSELAVTDRCSSVYATGCMSETNVQGHYRLIHTVQAFPFNVHETHFTA